MTQRGKRGEDRGALAARRSADKQGMTARGLALLGMLAGMTFACGAPPPSAAAAPAAAAPVSTAPFIVAIAYRDTAGTSVEPIARFTGAEWINTWPRGEDMNVPAPPLEQIPDAWLGRPVPRDWNVWSAGSTRQRVRIAGSKRGNGCEALIDLTADQATSASLTMDEPLVAVDTNQRVGAIRGVTHSDPERATLEPVIRAAFEANAQRAFDEDVVLGRRLSPDALAQRPVTIDYLVRPASSDGPVIYYFEAARHVVDGGEDGVAVGGWLRQDAAGRWIAADVKSRGLGGDGPPLPATVPLATFPIAGRAYWLLELRGYEGVAASIVEITGSGVKEILNIARAGC